MIYDPNRKHTISAKTHHMDVDYSCYEGRRSRAGRDIVLSRGSVDRQERRVHREEGRRQVHQALDRRLRADGMSGSVAASRAPGSGTST